MDFYGSQVTIFRGNKWVSVEISMHMQNQGVCTL